MGDTKIEWTDKVWNVTRGCRRISAGCGGANGEGGCYAERMAYRFSGPGQAYEGLVKMTANGPRWTGKGRFAEDKLAEPLSWRKPVRVFVDSMSDLFFEEFTNEQIAAVFGVMAACPRHTFQVLTKRPDRMREWFEWVDGQTSHGNGRGETHAELCRAAALTAREWRAPDGSMPPGPGRDLLGYDQRWPLPNVWLGVSVENQDAADERIPELLRTPAAVRFLSCEPLLGELDLRAYLSRGLLLACTRCRFRSTAPTATCPHDGTRMVPDVGIDQVIIGAESGPGARPADPAWFRSIVERCRAAGVAVFVKQIVVDGKLRKDVREFPVDLQIQEFPR